jgi:MYXO-CTERM domain-containing protein
MTRSFVPAALVLSLLFAAAARAECPTITPQVDALAPADGSTGLPLNAAVSFGLTPRFAGYAPSVTLSSAGGAELPGALIAGPADSFLFLPDSPLTQGVTYQIQVVDSSGAGTPLTTTFTTGADTDVTDPAIPVAPTLSIVEYTNPVRTDECLQPGYWVLNADWEDVVGETSVLYVLDANFEDLIPQEITAAGSVPQAHGESLVSAESERNFNAPADSEVRARIYAVDGAGRQGNSPEGVLETPPAPDGGGSAGCGCTLSSTSASPAGACLLGLAALLLRRRR